MNIDSIHQKIELIFSDVVMIAFALLIIPVVLAQNFLNLTPAQETLVTIIDWFIWTAFFLEFFLKLGFAQKRIKWLWDNKLDSLVSVIVIVSPILEYSLPIMGSVPMLRLLRLTRLARFTRLLRLIRLVALGTKVKRSWGKLNLKVYAAFFVIIGIGIIASFITTGLSYSSADTTWISLFVSIFGVFYSVMISFFVMHVWGKYTTLGNEIGKEINSLKNVCLFSFQLKKDKHHEDSIKYLLDYIESVVDTLWTGEIKADKVYNKFARLITHFSQLYDLNSTQSMLISNILAELRIASIAQATLLSAAKEKTPKILWILLIFLSTVLVGSFIFLGFQNQLLATILITMVSAVTGLVAALMFDIDTPFQAGFWNISPAPYFELKEFIGKKAE